MRLWRFLNGEAPVLFFVVALSVIIGGLLDKIDRTKFEYAARDQAEQIGIEVLQSISTRINNKAIGLGRLVTAAEMTPDLTHANFEIIAKRLIEDLDAVDNSLDQNKSAILRISVAPDLVVEHIYPLEGNRAFIGVDYRQTPTQLADIEMALEVRTPVVSRPFLPAQGRRVIAVHQRIVDFSSGIRGVASVALDLDIFANQLAERIRGEAGYQVGFFVDGFGGLGDPNAFQLDPVVLELHSRNIDWTIAILPEHGWPAMPLLTPTRLSVTIISLVLLWLVHDYFRRNHQQRKKERRLEKGIDALSAGFVIFDENDRLIHWNETYRDLFGYGAILRTGISLKELLQAGLQKGIFRVAEGTEDAWISHNVETHQRAEGSVEVEMADGRWIKILSRRTEDGDLVGVRFDITDLKRAQLKAERLNNAKSEMISVISHELRTPLTTILGFGRLMKLGPPNKDKQAADAFTKDAVDRIVSAGENLLKLINQMLDYVNLGAETSVLTVATCNLRKVIWQITDEIEPAAHEKGVRLEVIISSSNTEVDVAADPIRVAQILENLLSNAVKFSSTGGTVRVLTQTGPKFAWVTITDNGPGIPQNRHNEIFKEFLQLTPSGQRREGGIGLGLAMTKRLVELHGGQISVESVPGEGSAFTFSLPLQERVT